MAEPHRTLFVLVHQPFQSRYISFTPLTRLAPVIGPGLDGGGPTRLVAFRPSAGLAVVVCRRRHDLATVLTITMVAFFVRVAARNRAELVLPLARPGAVPAAPPSAAARRVRLLLAALVATMALGDRRRHDIVMWWPA